MEKKRGFAKGLTNYGDPAFSLYLRRSFAKSMGYSSEMLSRPVVGMPQLITMRLGPADSSNERQPA